MPRIIDQFGRKRCQKKRKDVDYKLISEFFQKNFVIDEQSAIKNSFSTYVCYAPDGLFWLNLYPKLFKITPNHSNSKVIYSKLSKIIQSYPKLSNVTQSYSKLDEVARGYSMVVIFWVGNVSSIFKDHQV